MLKEKPIIVQVFTSSFWGFWRSCLYILVAKSFKVKVIFHLLNAIDNFWEESSAFSKSLIRLALNKSDLLLVQSNGIKNFVNSITRTNVIAIYNGIKLREYDDSPPKNYLYNGKIKIVFLGALTHNKGVYDLIQASSKIKHKDISYIFIGSGDIEKLKRYGKENGVGNQLTFVGEITDNHKEKLLIESDVFVLPSYAEGQPLAILEAMCAGLPIISTNVGSIPEIVEDGKNGFIIEPGNIEKLADKISLLIENKVLAKNISDHNYISARELYNIERVFVELSEVYYSL